MGGGVPQFPFDSNTSVYKILIFDALLLPAAGERILGVGGAGR